VTCGPHTSASEREGERRRGAGGPARRDWARLAGSKAGRGGGIENEKKRKEEKVGWAAGRIGLVRFVFFFSFFQILFKNF
jgi:hypothetical protein